ncbi:hypothetical protein SAMD00023353_0702010 [Rosellinia necatrix]|uniref:Uncharacterized protein n=1 Tax=Rosellinia necatrix TaxID=77044 RepID=A0A1S7UM07_ROSNE|nr:hypothetical protein SAMD00023353_0702010 [Rosellinia necatrix]
MIATWLNRDKNVPLNLKVVGSANRSLSHRKPAHPYEERPQFPELHAPPHSFGELPTICKELRWKEPKDGVNHFVYARPKIAEIVAEEGLAREDGDTPNIRMNDPLYHPEFNGYYNYDGRRFNELTAIEKNILDIVVHYPDVKKGIMRAPIYFRNKNFSLPEAKQPWAFTRFFEIPELFGPVVEALIPRQGDLVKLCQVSQLTARSVASIWMRFNTTTHDFKGWDTQSVADVWARESRRLDGDRPKDLFGTSVFISPVRAEDQGPEREVMRNKSGYPLNPSVDRHEGSDFTSSMVAHYKMLNFAHLNGHAVRHLVLHSMPWVDVSSLRHIMRAMPKLEALCVYQCFLLPLGETRPLLRGVNRINAERAGRGQSRLALDFSPFYYKGPRYKPDGGGHVGEYGICPEETEWLESTAAVASLLLSVWRLCDKGKQDFFAPGTGFRGFLDRLPIRTLPDILASIKVVVGLDTNKYYWGLRRNTPPGVDTLYKKDPTKLPIVSTRMASAMTKTAWQDAIVCCHGQKMLASDVSARISPNGKNGLEYCVWCVTFKPVYFTGEHVVCPDGVARVMCHGCKLENWNRHHNWRLNWHRRELARRIFARPGGQERPLQAVLDAAHAWLPIPPPQGPWGMRPPEEPEPTGFGEVEGKILVGAVTLWNGLTVTIPDQLAVIRGAIRIIDDMYPELSFVEREAKSQRREELRTDEARLEAQLGMGQRSLYRGSLKRPCRAWELNIIDFRARVAIDNGLFVNNSPIPIYDYESNVAAMLSSAGGLHCYWVDDTSSDGGK